MFVWSHCCKKLGKRKKKKRREWVDRIQVKESTTETTEKRVEWTEFKWKKQQQKQQKKEWSGRTVIHARHRRSVPLGKIRVEGRSRIERCRRMSVPWWTESKNKIEKT
jgi:hypothetical protein